MRVPAAVRERPPAGAIRGQQLVQLAQQVVGQVQQAGALLLLSLLVLLLVLLVVWLRWGGQQGRCWGGWGLRHLLLASAAAGAEPVHGGWRY